jgi:hypothetical protein
MRAPEALRFERGVAALLSRRNGGDIETEAETARGS